MANAALEIIKEVVFRNRDRHGIPPLDGALHPNDLLDKFQVVTDTLPELDDIAIDETSTLYISSGNSIVRLDKQLNQTVFAKFDMKVGGLSFHIDGRLMACVGGKGVVLLGKAGEQTWVNAAEGRPIRCPLSAVAAPDGRIYITDATAFHDSQDWVRDLMEKRKAGRLICYEPDTRNCRVLLSDLHYPHGLAISRHSSELLLTESWAHTLSAFPLDDIRQETRKLLYPNFPGYPGRIEQSSDGGFWLCFFARRSGLVEFVLSEDKYRKEMIRTIENTNYWVAPALVSEVDITEYSQAGRRKVFGVMKPYAPPRSYGLVIELDENCEPIRSFHSRVGGKRHGITGVLEHEGNLYVVSKGNSLLLKLNLGGEVNG